LCFNFGWVFYGPAGDILVGFCYFLDVSTTTKINTWLFLFFDGFTDFGSHHPHPLALCWFSLPFRITLPVFLTQFRRVCPWLFLCPELSIMVPFHSYGFFFFSHFAVSFVYLFSCFAFVRFPRSFFSAHPFFFLLP